MEPMTQNWLLQEEAISPTLQTKQLRVIGSCKRQPREGRDSESWDHLGGHWDCVSIRHTARNQVESVQGTVPKASSSLLPWAPYWPCPSKSWCKEVSWSLSPKTNVCLVLFFFRQNYPTVTPLKTLPKAYLLVTPNIFPRHLISLVEPQHSSCS